jgi:uncharacterized coiled-coil DUF342 family protein
MTWQPLHIRGLSFNGPNRPPVTLEFDSGLNVIWGASNTGKSFAIEAIDFLLGSSKSLRRISQRNSYDRARLALESPIQELFTLERGTNGGAFRLYEGALLEYQAEQASEMTLQPRHLADRTDTLSSYLLSLIGLSNKLVQTNQSRNTRNLSFRDLAKLVLVKEGEIIKESSPILTGQYTSKTVEFSAFKLLLTGIDDSAQVAEEVGEIVSAASQNNVSKIELIDELIDELQYAIGVNEVNRVQIEDRIDELNLQIQTQEAALTQVGSELNERNSRRREIFRDIQNLSNRIDEIDFQLSRFELLKNSYQVDINRLASIEESGSFFVYLERTQCPLCGTPPNEQHQNESCDGNVEQFVHAARGEISKVQKLLEELEQTISELVTEQSDLDEQREQINYSLQELNQEIEAATAPLSSAENSLSNLISQVSEQQQILDKFERLNSYRERKRLLLQEISQETNKKKSRKKTTEAAPIDLSTTVLDDFAQHILRLLQSWNFPDADRVHFDQSERDLVINGQLRSDNGKGVRAVTHAAMTIGLMEFCQQRDLPHPGFVVLDSPLLAYKSPEEVAEDPDLSEGDIALAASDVKPRFYDYLSRNLQDSQVIIMENTPPPQELEEGSNIICFTRLEDVGRYGFFPIGS